MIFASVLLLLHLAKGRDITTVHLNKNLTFKTLIPNDSPDMECLVAEGEIPLPQKISICFRSNPMTHVHHEKMGWNWRTIISLGTMNTGGTQLRSGLVFGQWWSGPWLGIQTNTSDSPAWTFTYSPLAWPFQVIQELSKPTIKQIDCVIPYSRAEE